MSLCDKCYNPGHCCSEIWLNKTGTTELVTFWLDKDINAQIAAYDLPFEATDRMIKYVDSETGREYAAIALNCPKLGKDGRCTIYETRPQLCRDFPPDPEGSPLCVHYSGAEMFNEAKDALGELK